MTHRRPGLLLKSSIAVWLCLVPLFVFATPASFRFAWLSDTHVGSATGEEDLRAAVRDINAMTNLSFVMHSGDVTEYGSRDQLRLAKELLDGLKLPCHVVPGNHDTKWSESGATDFGRLWKEDRFVFEEGGFRFIGLHEGPIMKMGDGHWSPQDVRWLETVLKEMPDKKQPLVFVTHYPVDNQIANWYAVLDLLKKYNIQVILCGHGHANHKLNFEGVPGVMGRSNLRAANPVGGFNLVEVKDGVMTFSERTIGTETLAPWHSVVLCKHDYASDTNHYARPDFSVNSRFPLVKEVWKFDTGYTIAATPAIWQEVAIIGDAAGTVYGLALATGQPQWKFKTGNAVYSTPAISGNTVVVASTDGNIYALDAATGKKLWLKETTRPIVASPAISGSIVYLGSSEGKFRALELSTGNLVWEFDDVNGFIETKPLLYEGKVIFGAWDQCLYALDAANGKLLWRWKGGRSGTLFSPAACWPVAADGKVFIVAPDRKMTAIDAATGNQIWRTGAPQYEVRETIGISEDQTRVYARSMNDFFYAFSTTSTRPEKLWSLNAHFGYDINSAMIVEKAGTTFYGTKNGLLFALDGKKGQIQWEHKIGVGVMNTVAPLSSTRVLATDFDGQVVMLEAKGVN